jgi:uncharacterized protein
VSSDWVLIGSTLLMGLAATPHCAAMCGAPCAAIVGRGAPAPQTAFLGARLMAYAAAGALASASVGALAAASQASPALRPLWVLLHLGLLTLGVFLLWRGRQPAWLAGLGRVQAAGPGVAVIRGPRRVSRSAAAGLLWVAWPCGLLQSALLVASLTSTAWAGATAMAAFAAASSAGLVFAPWLWQRLGPGLESPLVRVAGALLATGSLFALGHGVWPQLAAWCGLA